VTGYQAEGLIYLILRAIPLIVITVLYVDDEPALLDIARRFLEKNSEFKVYTAISAREGLDIIRDKKPQAVVSDYYMPEMDGMAFLKEIRKTSSIPFIMFTGRGSEIVAMEATNSGADYYIQKGADPRALFAELTYKLRLAVSDHKTETEEQRQRKTIRTLIDKTYGAVIIHSPEGRIYDVNSKMLELFHLTRDDALKMTIEDLSMPDTQSERRVNVINKVLAGDDQFLIWEAKRPGDNTRIKLEKFLTRIPFGNNTYILCNMRDISQKEKLEEMDAAVLYAANHTQEGIVCCDEEGRIIFINTTWSGRLGISPTDKIGKPISDLDPTVTSDKWKELRDASIPGTVVMHSGQRVDSQGRTAPVSISLNQYFSGKKRFYCLYFREETDANL
jgi:PAS domain S-box-containing protein